MSYVWAIVSLLNNLWDAYKQIQQSIATKRAADREEKKRARNAAIEAAKKAQTEEEWSRAQDDIHNSAP